MSKEGLLNEITEAHPLAVKVRYEDAADIFTTQKRVCKDTFLIAKMQRPKLTEKEFLRDNFRTTESTIEKWCRDNRIDVMFEPKFNGFIFAKK